MALFQFDMSKELLQEVLHLPGTSKIIDIRMSDNPCVITFIVEESNLPSFLENMVMKVVPLCHKERTTWDWNLEDRYGQIRNVTDSQD